MRYVFIYVVVGLIFNGVSLAMGQSQYLRNPRKKMPKYSPIGELLRMNKSLILPDGNYN